MPLEMQRCLICDKVVEFRPNVKIVAEPVAYQPRLVCSTECLTVYRDRVNPILTEADLNDLVYPEDISG
jgi:hypothetical protein